LRAKAGLALAALVAGAAAVAQDRSPESILPPGFDQPATPAPAPSSAPAPTTAAPAPSATAALPGGVPSPTPSPSPSASPTMSAAELAAYEMPAFARRSLDRVGAADAFSPQAFGDANGRWLELLMRRTAAPLPSRWLSITLRRMLVSAVDTPAGVNGADFAAERAWLLLRMGESVAARALVEGVDLDNATPKLSQVWMQAMLATGDPGGLCPMAPIALSREPERGWIMARAMCAALGGPAGSARSLFAQARRRRIANGVDLALVQKVMGAGANSGQAATVEWEPVGELTAWRWGLATATGETVPDTLYATAGPQLSGWRAQAPAIALADRVAPAERAATLGVLSSAALVDLFSAANDLDDTPSGVAAVANDLRTAFMGGDVGARKAALETLWNGGGYARLILTAAAAARLPVDRDDVDADRLVAAMLAAGLDRPAMRWAGAVPEGGDAWAMLRLADPEGGRVGYGSVTGYAAKENAERKRRLFFAGLAGLGRLSPDDVERGAGALDVKIGARNGWTRAIDRAASTGQPGTVVLLAAIGMQTPAWSGVPAEALFHIVAALRAVGMDGEARMIAAEAIARG
jgi:hypothetical protein